MNSRSNTETTQTFTTMPKFLLAEDPPTRGALSNITELCLNHFKVSSVEISIQNSVSTDLIARAGAVSDAPIWAETPILGHTTGAQPNIRGTLALRDPGPRGPTPADGEDLHRFAALAGAWLAERQARLGAESRLRQADQASLAHDRYLATMAHELRSPLNAVIGLAELVISRPAEASIIVGMIKDSGEHLLAIVEDIMAFAKIDGGGITLDLRPINLVEIVSGLCRLYSQRAEEKSISIIQQASTERAIINGDVKLLRQIFTNILVNSLHYTPENGTVTIQIGQLGGQVHVMISDTGVGIAPDTLQRLGEPFFRADAAGMNRQGTGLGLAITRRLVELLQGDMRLVSAPGVGTAVIIAFPAPAAGA